MSSPRMNATGSTVSTYGLSPRALLPFFKARGPPEVDKATMQRRGQYDAREGQIVIDKGPSIVAVADKDNDGIVTKAEFSHWHWRQKGRGPNPKEWQTFAAADLNGDGKIQRAEFMKYLAKNWGLKFVRAEQKVLDEGATSVEDSLDTFLDTYSIINQSPREKYTKPATSSQVVGWNEATRIVPPKCSPRHCGWSRKTCPETQYANAYSAATGLTIPNIWTYDRCGENKTLEN